MEQLVFFDIPSPCINVCQSDNRGFCLGCFRSRDERFNWQQMSDAQKMETIRLCRDRKKRRAYAAFKAKQDAEKAERLAANGSLPFDEADYPKLDLGDFSLD